MKQRWNIYSLIAGLAGLLASCDYIYDDLKPCPSGLYLSFEYDYNLQRADFFADHVGSVTAYVFDEQGSFVMSKTESGDVIRQDHYEMQLDLQPGHYQYVVEAYQKPYEETIQEEKAHFVRTVPEPGDSMSVLCHRLECEEHHYVTHAYHPLDTLWHGMETRPVEVRADEITRDTVSVMRNTKEISVMLREIDDPSKMDVNNYTFRILGRSDVLQWNNEPKEEDYLIYTPFMTHNTDDRPVSGTPYGRMAHADFMTSRVIYHDRPEDDAILSVVNRQTGVEVIRVNLADLLSRLRTAADLYRYSPQEFLDRGYEYQLVFFLRGDTWDYVNVEISTLSWAKRVQNESL